MSKEFVFCEILRQMNPSPPHFSINPEDFSWESFEVPEGYEKPSKEEYETKFAELYALEPLRILRIERDLRLLKCDYIFVADYITTLSEDKLNEWRAYRQALRDITNNTQPQLDETGKILTGVEWPSPPA